MKPLVIVSCVLGLCVVAAFFVWSSRAVPSSPTFTYTALDVPDSKATTPYGMNGDKVFGTYLDSSGTLRGFVYDLRSQQVVTLEEPAPLIFPIPTGLFGDTLVGFASDGVGKHGFFYDVPSRRYTLFDHPNAAPQSPENEMPGTLLSGITETTFFGHYRDAAGRAHGFLCDRTTRQFTPIDHPGASGVSTFVTALAGHRVVGYTTEGDATHGFLLDSATGQFTPIDGPWNFKDTEPAAISGDTIVGTYADGVPIRHGFVYDIASKQLTSLDHPQSQPPPRATSTSSGIVWTIVGETQLTGVVGTSLVGYYTTPAGQAHGFLAVRR